MFKKYKKHIIAFSSISVMLVLLIWQPWKKGTNEDELQAKVIKGRFETYVMAIGELQALKAVDITVPEISFRRELDIWVMKIMSLVEEGKIVKKGDPVATLDPTEIEERLVQYKQRLEEYYNSFEDAKLDSSLTLAESRDKIQKAKDLLLDKQIKVEQSVYESKAIQRQAQIELEQAERSLIKSERDLARSERKAKVRIERTEDKIKYYENIKALYEQLMIDLRITAPADGMIVYGISYEGRKVKVGSHVGRHAPLIATLPDLNTLISEMFVKEIDIAKIKIGQTVRLSIDAFPNKEYTGTITDIANIGQEIPGEFQNGFKVLVKLDPFTDALLPGMTTSNTVITNIWENALMVPKKAVFGTDSARFVMKKSGLSAVKQQVQVEGENEDFFRIVKGLEINDRVLLDYEL
jgi:multidrug efflux pump subunit AcrA (membrane-fusion protein)